MVSVMLKLGKNPPNTEKNARLLAQILMTGALNGIWILNLWYGIAFLPAIMIILPIIIVLRPSVSCDKRVSYKGANLKLWSSPMFLVGLFKNSKKVLQKWPKTGSKSITPLGTYSIIPRSVISFENRKSDLEITVQNKQWSRCLCSRLISPKSMTSHAH